MIDSERVFERLSEGRGSGIDLDPEPTRADLRDVVQAFKADGLCGRRVAEQRLVPYFIANDGYGQRELDLLEDVLAEEYEGTDLCLRTRRSECSRLRGGCKGSR
ncbi:hypothetical protein C488_09359 [Natrinema pellirubrum DSM 15624]|uniref:Uncharacterized protein n=1 Tax=Natrinema pellirubrum (strain DSM 15624 / CIP 106293 / JCM 10476 / NCIMB 786 / 157) TaxID=797303 RepID=L0JQG9_NATP1|nr:hypothetical protein [Natrinema pellirubrum]AGB32847.1 hypothetical protein Natpe_3054 [Natrinema pellirubrum DSM 15624]ELY75607.1 hypothetical protein C488_09359 [Natrinema pellirubrum DSM 15624]